MGEQELVVDFIGKLSHIVFVLRGLKGKVKESDIVSKPLWVLITKFDSITSPIEQLQDMDTMTIEETIRK